MFPSTQEEKFILIIESAADADFAVFCEVYCNCAVKPYEGGVSVTTLTDNLLKSYGEQSLSLKQSFTIVKNSSLFSSPFLFAKNVHPSMTERQKHNIVPTSGDPIVLKFDLPPGDTFLHKLSDTSSKTDDSYTKLYTVISDFAIKSKGR